MFLRADLKPEASGMVRTVYETSGVLLSEIRGQKVLLAAESGSFEVVRKPVDVADCLKDAVILVSHLQVAQDKDIRLARTSVTETMETDPVLLGQVLTHLLKNALESTLAGGEVRISAERVGEKIQFTVWNEGLISPEARSQMFQRSFSTKGAGRGIGTYSLRLFVEGYLGGKVSYSSSACDGTAFVVTLPMRP
jgi:signal transduction histidine kinase